MTSATGPRPTTHRASPPATDAADVGTAADGHRIQELDALRGLALSGIHVVNVYQQVVLAKVFDGQVGAGIASLPDVVRYGFYERFFPVFTLLFGVSFAIFLERASARTAHPRVVLARRLGVLLLIGAVHFVLHPGEVLTAYALLGLVFLLPASFLRPRLVLGVGLVLLVLGAGLIAGYGVMPGLLLVGFALHRLGVTDALARRPGRLAVAFVTSAALTAGYLVSVAAGVDLPRLTPGVGSTPVALAGVVAAVAYASGFLLLLRTPVGPALSAFFAPMGRMALTNYLAATIMLLLGSAALGIDGLEDGGRVAALAVAIVLVEAAWSRLWLRRFAYGPVEWVWRCATWWAPVPLRRPDGRATGAG